MPELILMRGIPGSGKSTWAKAHSEKHGHVVLSTDDYWYAVPKMSGCFHCSNGPIKGCCTEQGACCECKVAVPDGKYRFDKSKLGIAHAWNQGRVRNAMMTGTNVIVDNTNLDSFAVRAYFDLAIKYGYSIHVEVMDASLKTCLNRNMDRTPDRRIPEEVIRTMYAKFLTPLDVGREEERAYTRKLEADIATLKATLSDAQEVLNQVWDYLEERFDVFDGDDGEPRPNDAMGLGGQVERVLEGMEKLV